MIFSVSYLMIFIEALNYQQLKSPRLNLNFRLETAASPWIFLIVSNVVRERFRIIDELNFVTQNIII